MRFVRKAVLEYSNIAITPPFLPPLSPSYLPNRMWMFSCCWVSFDDDDDDDDDATIAATGGTSDVADVLFCNRLGMVVSLPLLLLLLLLLLLSLLMLLLLLLLSFLLLRLGLRVGDLDGDLDDRARTVSFLTAVVVLVGEDGTGEWRILTPPPPLVVTSQSQSMAIPLFLLLLLLLPLLLRTGEVAALLLLPLLDRAFASGPRLPSTTTDEEGTGA